MGLFWKRKSGDQFVSLNINAAVREDTDPSADAKIAASERAETSRPVAVPASALEPVPTGGGPTPVPAELPVGQPAESRPHSIKPSIDAREAPAVSQVLPVEAPRQKPVPSRSPFQTSVLGLNLSIEELQAQEAALEQEFSARFRRAVSATRETLSERLDTVFQGLKQIDENLLDELEEALIAADIGVATTQHVLETVRRGVARKADQRSRHA